MQQLVCAAALLFGLDEVFLLAIAKLFLLEAGSDPGARGSASCNCKRLTTW
jgi:hypothetical protein